VELGKTSVGLKTLGVETLAVVASPVDRARLYFKYRSVPIATAADPDLLTHRAFGVPSAPLTPATHDVVEAAAVTLAGEIGVPVEAGQAYAAIDRLDGFELVEADAADMQRHQAQFTGEFLVDRAGVVRWVNIEGARDGAAGFGRLATDEELTAAARQL